MLGTYIIHTGHMYEQGIHTFPIKEIIYFYNHIQYQKQNNVFLIFSN